MAVSQAQAQEQGANAMLTNPDGKQIGNVPPHITLDTEAATADWFGVFSSEKVSLDAQ